jgi:hypothetical protein
MSRAAVDGFLHWIVGLAACGLLVSGAHAQEKGGVHVCVGTDNVMRHALGAACRPGETSYLLAEEKGDIQAPEEAKGADKELSDLKGRLKTLTERVAGLEQASRSESGGNGQQVASRVYAPFEVLDKSGNAILRISDREDEPSKGSRVLIARGEANNYSLFFKTSGGVVATGIGQTREGAGGLYIYDVDGKNRVALLGTEGVVAYNKSGIAVTRLGALGSGNGYLTIGNSNGNSMVEAGVSEGRGLVRAYPTTGIAPVPVPFFIRGGVWKK